MKNRAARDGLKVTFKSPKSRKRKSMKRKSKQRDNKENNKLRLLEKAADQAQSKQSGIHP